MTPADAVRAACALINERRARGRLLVGIDGAGGAGKSTLANGISEAFGARAAIIRCDDFYRPLNTQCTPEEAYEEYFDWRRLRDEALIPLRSGQRARYQRYDWIANSLAEWIEVESREIILVEGVFATRPGLRALLEVAIFIETPREERIRRMLARPQPDTSWIDQWMAAEDWYLALNGPHRSADLVVQGF
jgi:uridine kinase